MEVTEPAEQAEPAEQTEAQTEGSKDATVAESPVKSVEANDSPEAAVQEESPEQASLETRVERIETALAGIFLAHDRPDVSAEVVLRVAALEGRIEGMRRQHELLTMRSIYVNKVGQALGAVRFNKASRPGELIAAVAGQKEHVEDTLKEAATERAFWARQGEKKK